MIVGYFKLGSHRKRCSHKFELDYFCANHQHDDEDDFAIIWCNDCGGFVSVEMKGNVKED